MTIGDVLLSGCRMVNNTLLQGTKTGTAMSIGLTLDYEASLTLQDTVVSDNTVLSASSSDGSYGLRGRKGEEEKKGGKEGRKKEKNKE